MVVKRGSKNKVKRTQINRRTKRVRSQRVKRSSRRSSRRSSKKNKRIKRRTQKRKRVLRGGMEGVQREEHRKKVREGIKKVQENLSRMKNEEEYEIFKKSKAEADREKKTRSLL